MRRLFRASLDDLDMCLEEEWVDSMASFARSLPMQDLKDTMSGNLARKANTVNEADQLLDEIASMINSNTQVKMEVGTAQRWCVSTHWPWEPAGTMIACSWRSACILEYM